MKRIIAFSLWGEDPKYVIGAVRNARLAPEIYPGWICRFYVATGVPPAIVGELNGMPHVEIEEREAARGWEGLFWRFLPAGEPDVDMMISRDADSRLSDREAAAVDEWVASGKSFHIMRDHPRHNLPILGGMWGVRGGSLGKISERIEEFTGRHSATPAEYGLDQRFLRDEVFPAIQGDSLVHDEFFSGRPFPGRREGGEYVGRILTAEDRPADPSVDAMLRDYFEALQRCGYSSVGEALAEAPNPAKGHFRLAQKLKRLGQLEPAAGHLEFCLLLVPGSSAAHNNLGTVLHQMGKVGAATSHYRRAIELNTDFAEPHSNLAMILSESGQRERALEHLKAALRNDGNHLPALRRFAALSRDLSYLGPAIAAYRRIAKLKPGNSEPWRRLGEIFESRDDYPESLTCFERVRELGGGGAPAAIQCRIDALHLKMCDWNRYEARFAGIAAAVVSALDRGNPSPVAPYEAAILGLPQPLQRRIAERQSAIIFKKTRSQREQCRFDYEPGEKGDGRLRIGYISPDLRQHAVGRLMKDVFARHDRERVEVFAYSLLTTDDEIRTRIESGCDRFVDLAGMETVTAARQIHGDGIHVLIDLAGYTTHARPDILALKPAPAQAQFLGFPNTMGAEFVGFLLADEELVSPEMAGEYREKVVYLPHAFVTSGPLSGLERPGREALNLPEDTMVYACFNRHWKVTPDLFAAWMEILREVEGSVLWLSGAPSPTSGNLRSAALGHEVDPDRLIFADYDDRPRYLARHRAADLFLDTFQYAGGSTTATALQCGLPVLTRRGSTNAARMGASLCAAAGFGSMIATDTADYVNKAVELGRNRARLTELQNDLRGLHETAPLFKPGEFARSIEDACEELRRRTSSR